ncbi:hypothetical protein OB905_11785 [Halobacteria archaeon AArc-dxtr1]|nr:hypothetical protein [Halobacteria archaeon AArc-dxtr1]
MGRNLNHNSDIVELHENTPDRLTPIMTVKPERGTILQIRNAVPQGDAVGIPIYADLVSESGDSLPTDTDVVLTARRPGDDRFQTVSQKEDNISTWNNKSISEQQDSAHVDSVKHELRGEAINIRDVDEFAVEVDTDEVIDWEESKLYFERSGLSERQK